MGGGGEVQIATSIVKPSCLIRFIRFHDVIRGFPNEVLLGRIHFTFYTLQSSRCFLLLSDRVLLLELSDPVLRFRFDWVY